MEEIVSLKGDLKFSFRAGIGGPLLKWPVPRAGEFVRVRRFTAPVSTEGYVERVEYYYSSGNNGPVVMVHLG